MNYLRDRDSDLSSRRLRIPELLGSFHCYRPRRFRNVEFTLKRDSMNRNSYDRTRFFVASIAIGDTDTTTATKCMQRSRYRVTRFGPRPSIPISVFFKGICLWLKAGKLFCLLLAVLVRSRSLQVFLNSAARPNIDIPTWTYEFLHVHQVLVFTIICYSSTPCLVVCD